MNTWPQLSRAPIVEGLIDVRVEPAAGMTFELLQSAADELAEEFPARQVRRRFQAEFVVSETQPAAVSANLDAPDGIVLRSADQKWVAQFRLDGFSLSRLEPYTSWKELRSKAVHLWDYYSAKLQPVSAIRLATRYINRIQIPQDESFDKTFATTFVLPATLPQAVAGYLLRIVVPLEGDEAVALLTQSLEGQSSECIFDLDVFSERITGFKPSEIWARLDRLRDLKNELFFNSLTEAALERYK